MKRTLQTWLCLFLLTIGTSAQSRTEMTLEDNQIATGQKAFTDLYSFDNFLFLDGVRYTNLAAALAALPALGGTIIVPPGYSENYTSTQIVGTGRIGVTNNQVTINLGSNVVINCKITNVTACWRIANGSQITGAANATCGGSACLGASTLSLDPTASITNFIEPAYKDGTEEQFQLSNLHIKGWHTATITGAALDVESLGDGTHFDNLNIEYWPSILINIQTPTNPVCCGVMFFNDWVNGGGLTNGVGGAVGTSQPVVINSTTGNIHGVYFFGGSITNAGQNTPLVSINGNNHLNFCRNIGFYGTHFEQDVTPAVNSVTVVDCNEVSFRDNEFTNQFSLSGAHYAISETTANYSTGLKIESNYTQTAGVNWLTDSRFNTRSLGPSRTITGNSHLVQYADAIGDGQVVLATTLITANTCVSQAFTLQTAPTITSDVIRWSYASTPVGVTGYGTGGLQISTYPTAGNANVVVCNVTGASITPGAISLNLRVDH